jgi:hypothetical protein
VIDRAALLELLKSTAGNHPLGKKHSWQWEIEAHILTVRHFEGKPGDSIPTVRQWRLVPIGDGG